MNTVKKNRGGDGRSGFTLIELAIVLIIIGLIIGAVLKGQDLITNARGKRMTSFIRQAEVAQWTYYDRNGDFASDGEAMDESTVDNFKMDLPLGGSTFYIKYGTNSTNHYIAVVIGSSWDDTTQSNTLTDSAQLFARSVDVSIDGEASASSGSIVGYDTGNIDNVNATAGITIDEDSPTVTDWSDAEAIVYVYD